MHERPWFGNKETNDLFYIAIFNYGRILREWKTFKNLKMLMPIAVK